MIVTDVPEDKSGFPQYKDVFVLVGKFGLSHKKNVLHVLVLTYIFTKGVVTDALSLKDIFITTDATIAQKLVVVAIQCIMVMLNVIFQHDKNLLVNGTIVMVNVSDAHAKIIMQIDATIVQKVDQLCGVGIITVIHV